MRILHAIHSADVKGGGPIEGIKQLSRLNIQGGHQVEVVSLDDPAEPWLKDFDVPIHALGPSYLGYGYTPRFVPWLREHHRDYDVVVVNGIWQYNSLGVWQVLRRSSTPYCVFTHGMLDPWFKHRYPWKHLKKWLYWPWGEYRVLRDALAVLFTTDEERRLARRSFWLYHCDELVVSYGINPPEGDAEAQRALFFERFPDLRGQEILLYLGRIHEKKGVELLLGAFARILARDDVALERKKALRLFLAGSAESPYGQRMIALAQELGLADRVVWGGQVAGDLKWGAFRAASAFVLPSHQENFGIAVAEALACGAPVLISNRINIWREVKLHQAGLVESDDLAGAERLLAQWLRLDEPERARMARNARRCFDRCFNIGNFANSFIESLRLLGLPG